MLDISGLMQYLPGVKGSPQQAFQDKFNVTSQNAVEGTANLSLLSNLQKQGNTDKQFGNPAITSKIKPTLKTLTPTGIAKPTELDPKITQTTIDASPKKAQLMGLANMGAGALADLQGAIPTMDKNINSTDQMVGGIRQQANSALLKSGNPFAMAAGAINVGIEKTGGFTDASKGLGGGADFGNAAASLLLPGAGWFSGKTSDYSQNKESISGSFKGLNANSEKAKQNAGAKLLFGKSKANNIIDTQKFNENKAAGILNTNKELFQGQGNKANQFGLQAQLKQAGGFNNRTLLAKSGIKIKPENKGKFTEYCGGKVTSECIQKGKHSSSPAVRKRATFAANARKWKHENGGKFGETNSMFYGKNVATKNKTANTNTGKILANNIISRFIPEEYRKYSDTAWAAAELIPGVGSILGLADVGNDLYNLYHDDDITIGDLGNLALDVVGVLPGVKGFTTAAKAAKMLKANNAYNKLTNTATILKASTPSKMGEIRKSIKEAKRFVGESIDKSTKAAISRENPYLLSMQARRAGKFTEGKLDELLNTINPTAWQYNKYQNIGNKLDALNDSANLLGNVENINIKNDKKSTKQFKDGGKMNVIPEGALHAHKHNMDIDDVTKKGIPVITNEEGGKITQHAEIERDEIIFRKEVTKKLEELFKDGSEKAMIEAGELLAYEIMKNTDDRTKLIKSVQ